jgi:hypothetical protein
MIGRCSPTPSWWWRPLQNTLASNAGRSRLQGSLAPLLPGLALRVTLDRGR